MKEVLHIRLSLLTVALTRFSQSDCRTEMIRFIKYFILYTITILLYLVICSYSTVQCHCFKPFFKRILK